MMVSSQAQPDTVVLNSTEFRFPETHPGRAFMVKKVVVNGQQKLRKDAEVPPPNPPAGAAAPSAIAGGGTVSRDAMGRVLKGGDYASRLARIRKVHTLPTTASRNAQKDGLVTEAAQGPLQRVSMTTDASAVLTSNSPLIRSAKDLVRLESAEREAVRRRYGALSPEFWRRVSEMDENAHLEISVELAMDHPGYVNGLKVSREEQIANAKAWARARPKVRAEEIARRYGMKTEFPVSDKARTFTARATKSQILALGKAEGIVSIIEAVRPEIVTAAVGDPVDYSNMLASAYKPANQMTFYTSYPGATMEFGLTPNYVWCLDPDLRPLSNSVLPTRDDNSPHSEGTYHIFAEGTPGSPRYHFGEWVTHVGTFGDIQDSIIDHEISVISTSIIVDRRHPDSTDSRVVDRFAYIYPYPVFSLAADNHGHDLVPSNLTYNSLIVGNVQHYNNATYTVDFKRVPFGGPWYEHPWNSSQTRNPSAKYGSSRDWELPSLVAPGFSPDPWANFYSATGCVKTSSLNDWHAGGGTSFSAPVAAAMALHVRGALSGYPGPTKPLEVKAVLLATAENVDSGYTSPGLTDSRDGAGTVSGANAVKFAEQATFVAPYDTPVEQGLHSGWADSTMVGNPLWFFYQVPNQIPSGKHLRAVLTWSSSAGTNQAQNEVADLDLYVGADYGMRVSGSWNNNVEIVDIDAGDLTAGSNYAIKVDMAAFRRASDAPDYLYYTLAWTWVKDNAN